MQALRFYHTVKYLKVKQIFYRIFYPVKKLCYISPVVDPKHFFAATENKNIKFVRTESIAKIHSGGSNVFTFLNKTKFFGPVIDWQFKEYGLLWSFHLHYFDWLPELSVEKGLSMVNQYIELQHKGYFYNHSYIASLRIVNWIRFCIENDIREEKLYTSIYCQAHRLAAFPEYELMGNHLLENGIALVWAGLFFKEDKFQRQGEQILSEEFREQILSDGAHFEKSISYHTILLKRLLELSHYYKAFNESVEFYKILINNCSRMLSYVIALTGDNDFLPLFGDSNEGMTISVRALKSMAQNLPLIPCSLSPGASGIRKLEGNGFSVFFNLGNIPAAYQPGHAHADAFSFCLNVKGKPVVTDRGVSTYERNSRREEERSTAGHNTIVVAGRNSSDVWASFRMGKRAKSNWLIDCNKIIECEHNGYYFDFKIMHKRSVCCEDNKIVIIDKLTGWKGQNVMFFFHLYPGLQPGQNSGSWILNDGNISIHIEGADTILEDYNYAKSFNIVLPAKRIAGIANRETITTTIVFK